MEEGLLPQKRPGELKMEVRRLAEIAGPMAAATVAQFGLQAVSMMMVGHVNELELSGTSLAVSLANVTGFSLLLGMAGGLETLCGQAFGAQQYHKVGVYAYRAAFCLTLTCLPIWVIWLSMEKLLVSIGQDPLISHEAGKYAKWMIPALFAYSTSLPMMKFLQSQGLTLPMLLSSIASLCLHVPLCWVLVFKTGLGNAGAALSVSISFCANLVMLGLYIGHSPSCKATFTPPSMEAFRGICEFMRLAIPSTMMICLEWWSFELLILLAGFLPNPELETSVLTICLTTATLLYTVPYGIGAAASTRVSNELGAGNPEGARLAVRAAMIITLAEAAAVSSTLFALRRFWGYVYSDEQEVRDYVARIVPSLCISLVFDCLQAVLSGVARGCGWQDIGAFVNLGSFYLVGIPTASVLGFLCHKRGMGLWRGIMCGSAVQVVLLLLVTSFTNWQHQARKARERVLNGKLPLDNLLS